MRYYIQYKKSNDEQIVKIKIYIHFYLFILRIVFGIIIAIFLFLLFSCIIIKLYWIPLSQICHAECCLCAIFAA